MTSQNEKETSDPIINPKAGLTRGVRLWPDPDGILASPFTENGTKMGYVYVYGEEEPAVFDGTTWHPILAGNRNWHEMQEDVAAQYYTIVAHAETNEAYKQLANYVTGGASY